MVKVLVTKRPVIWQGKKRYPGDTLEMDASQVENLGRLYPGALAWEHDEPKPEILASPAALKLADEIGIDISQIVGSGKNGLITKADVERQLAEQAVESGEEESGESSEIDLPADMPEGDDLPEDGAE